MWYISISWGGWVFVFVFFTLALFGFLGVKDIKDNT